MQIGAHAPLPVGGTRGWSQPDTRLRRRVPPADSYGATLRAWAQMIGIGADLSQGKLVGAERAFHREPVDAFGSGPALGRAQDEHGPRRPRAGAVQTSGLSQLEESRRKTPSSAAAMRMVHGHRALAVEAPLDQHGGSVPREQRQQFGLRYPGQHRRSGDLLPVQVEYGAAHAVAAGIEKLVRVPPGGRCPSPPRVAHHAGHDEAGVVEGRPRRHGSAITAARRPHGWSGSLWAAMAWDAARERRTGGRAGPIALGRLAQCGDRARCRCLPARVGDDGGPPWPGRRRRGHRASRLDASAQVGVTEVEPGLVPQ